ncbi:alpha/beta hydrolase [Micromonospora polyrhachis]|uniref:Pimeloyl-ACP methyl ester carboxylesterase n=1 Tax=Micromonospora polyrhachis TaxID=1282883 RepID=A0A7W7SPL8_9ACTN|nr:alpha/beta hydrolase [Micromonospora polyrhachis]MBB4958629.1 pimeloyl-ACP methyl ester carboxylesterase [Micromonospora polyrhachis]
MSRRTSVSLNVVERGAGIPVLALHGWTPDHRLMLGCLEPIFANRPGYRRLYPDLPGMGVSPGPAEIASSDDVLDTVRDLIDELIGDTAFLLVGESYGGYLARALARRYPDQALGLALICPVGTVLDRTRRRVPQQQVLRPDPDLLAATDAQVAAEFADIAVVQTPETLRRFRDEVLAGLDLADIAAMDRIQRQWTLREDPEGGTPFTRPTLILTGRQDHATGYLDQFALLPHYPRATFAVLDVAGHNLQIEQPALFDALVGEWLDRVAAEH